MKKQIKQQRERFFSELNTYWKAVRNICASISVVLGAVVGSEYFGMIEPDEILYKIVKYSLFITATIALTAQNTTK